MYVDVDFERTLTLADFQALGARRNPPSKTPKSWTALVATLTLPSESDPIESDLGALSTVSNPARSALSDKSLGVQDFLCHPP